MRRLFDNELLKWKNNGATKPLMVIGLRQTGKTFTITRFCKKYFEDFIYIDLEKDDDIRSIFDESIDPDFILYELEIRYRKKISVEKTVFFFDEVQASERFIVSLKYFCEHNKPFKIICAGSLLGVKLNRFKSSFPVGKVQLSYMYPMTFEEFLLACDEDRLIDKIRSCYQSFSPMPADLHKHLIRLYRVFLCIGGMPEAVKDFLGKEKDIVSFNRTILSTLVDMYLADMSKYATNKSESIKISNVYHSIPHQLGKANRRFIYKNVESGASKRKYETSIDWLISSGMALSCHLVNTIRIPIKAYELQNMFKLYLSDVGLLTSISALRFDDILLEKDFMYKGAIAENYVACELAGRGIPLNYWQNDRKAEIDFLLYTNDGIIPMEVKASDNTASQSLRIYIDKHQPKYSIRFSTKNFGFENEIQSIPLYAVFCITCGAR